MKQSEDLFNLIKSLKRTEKTYFKKFSQFHIKGGQNNYVRIYDAIENQKTYDEKKLLDLFKGEPLTNQFWVAKNYLYNLILRSLELYHSSVDSELQSMLHRLEILYNKSLFDQCEKMVTKGIQYSDVPKYCIINAPVERESPAENIKLTESAAPSTSVILLPSR